MVCGVCGTEEVWRTVRGVHILLCPLKWFCVTTMDGMGVRDTRDVIGVSMVWWVVMRVGAVVVV